LASSVTASSVLKLLSITRFRPLEICKEDSYK